MKDSSPWDKYVLLLAGVVVAGLAGLFISKSLAFVDQFGLTPATPNNELPDTDTPRAKAAAGLVDTVSEWKSPNKGKGGSPLPLFKSITIVEIDGKLINMLDPDADLLRPPVSNAWLLNNDLDFLNAGVLDQDPDGDGFSNLEEWEGKKAPRSADSHPPYVNKLSMVGRKAQIYRLKFAAQPDKERFQVIHLATATNPRRQTFLMKVGETSGDKKFRIDSFEKKEVKGKLGNTIDASVLNITYLPDQTKYQLVRGIEEDIPTYFVELDFALKPGIGKDRYVKEGETFTLSKDPDTKYRVIKVEEDSVTITYETSPGQEKTIEIKKK